MSNRTIELNDRLHQYLLDHSLRETELARRLREVTAQLPMARMQIGPEQGQFMALLVKLLQAQRILEIGTFTGYSALCMASALPDNGQLVCCDMSEEWTAIGKPFWEEAGVAERIDLQLGPAIETMDRLLTDTQKQPFDIIFIDADKTNYHPYYERGLQLLRTGGLLMFDNTLWGGSVADPQDQTPDTIALRELNNLLRDDPRVDISLVPIGDGLTLARKN